MKSEVKMKILTVIAASALIISLPAFAADSLETRVQGLEAQVQTLEDQYAIEQLVVVKYSKALDTFDGKAYAANFTSDGVLVLGREFKGRAEIESMFTNPAAMMPPPKPGDPPRPPIAPMPKPVPGKITVPHVITNTSYKIDGNTATGRCYWQEIALIDGKPQITFAGHYDDVLRKVNGEWKFARRTINSDVPPGMAPPKKP
jgi:SnoaL-like domain